MWNKKVKSFSQLFFLLIIMLFLTGCISPSQPASKCTIIFEDNASIFFQEQIYEISKLDDLTVYIGLPHDYRISSVNYEDYSLSAKITETSNYDYYYLTLNHIQYSSVIRLSISLAYTTTYFDTSNTKIDTVNEVGPHLRSNSLAYHDINLSHLSSEQIPIGWNTCFDGTGLHIGFGSRFDHSGQQNINLYLETLPCTPASNFTYTQSSNGNLTITSYQESMTQNTKDIVIPAYINGYPVTTIGAHAFSNLTLERLVFPATVLEIESNAFGDSSITDFYFFDSIQSFPNDAFSNYQIEHIHINASQNPVYSGTYFDTLSDKVDYLYSLKDQKKLVLFCGSFARFGYDSSLIEASFPEYKVVNMGVYAYSNMLPQAKILQLYMKKDDILLHSPELDAIDTQFCGESDLDREFFCMMESNYDMLSLLDCRIFTNIFNAFTGFNQSRKGMEQRSYLDSPSYYDEERNLLTSFSYNIYGDYIVPRENNYTGTNFGIKRAYYNKSHIRNIDLNGINAMYDTFLETGIRVLFSYSSRSNSSLSSDSTIESIMELGQFFKDNLHAEIISPIEDSLVDPYYFYGTDNHLSTDGVAVHTKYIINKLQTVLEVNQ